MHFDKHTARDFGLVDNGNDTAFDPADGSSWKRVPLYDYGWGPENGYYKEPLPDAATLISILLAEESIEDRYGAAAIIERDYPEELLQKCERMMGDPVQVEDFARVIEAFHLEHPLNRSRIEGKSYDEIKTDSERWKRVSEYAVKTKEAQKRRASFYIGKR